MKRRLVVAVAFVLAGCPQKQVVAPPPILVPPVVAPEVVSAAGVAPTEPKLRLPRNFLPTGYTARLAIDPARNDFSASIAIAGIIDQPSTVIWLHGLGLTIQRATATKESSEIAIKVTQRGEDLLMLEAAQPLEPGAWNLMIDYTGSFDLVSTTGAFKQTVGDDTYVYTQLEATYARRVFPCLDEPDNKVPWKLTLDVPAKLTAVANTPVASEVAIADGKKRVEFAVTKPLPSYLVAFGVGRFELVDGGKTKGGTPVRIVTLAKRAADAAYAAQTTAKIVELTEDWFGTPYPYEKLDILIIPVTTGFGAMENAGLITFTETLALLDARASNSARYEWVIVAAHEIAHQWFGNLVTMMYWDDIWLNEGFANWLEEKTGAAFDPSWQVEEAALETRNKALASDSLVSARQIRQPIASADDILNAFDGITYNKGASVLAMFEAYVGREVFQRGVREYLKARAGGNATSTDFVSAIATAAGNPKLGAAFATFLEQPGTPEITATISCTAAPRVELTQRRYLLPGSPSPKVTTPWILPVCVAYDRAGKRAEACTLLDAPSGAVTLDTRTCPRWVMPNVNGRGYYRNAYTTAQVSSLRDEAWKLLSWSERRAVMFDVTAGARTGRMPLTLALSLVPKLLAGADRFTVPLALDLATDLDDLVPAELRGKYEYWLRQTFGPGATKAGLSPKDGDSLDLEETRAALISAVAWTAREPALVAEAIKLADRWRELPESIRPLVLSIAVDASAALFERNLRDVRTEHDRKRRDEIFDALGSVRDVDRQSRALMLVLDPKLDIRETSGLLFAGSDDATRANAQRFFAAHKAAIFPRYPKDGTTISVADFSSIFTSACKADQRDATVGLVRKEFSSLPGGARVVEQNIEEMDQCIARRKLLEPEIRAWLGGLRLPKPKP
jgi:alanyl aminopeptidase